MSNFQKYRDFGTKIACDKKLTEYNRKILDVRSKFYSAKELSDIIANKLDELLTQPLPTNTKTYDINSLETATFLERIIKPNIIKIPLVLAEILIPQNIKVETLSNIDTSNPAELSDIASEYINQEMETFLNDPEKSVDEVFSFLDTLSPLITNSFYIEVFGLLDRLNHFIIKTKFIQGYIEQKEAYNILMTYCKFDEKSLINDSFLWTNYEEDFILPININDGKIKLTKFFENPTQSKKEKLNRIEVEYFRYLEQRGKVLDKLKSLTQDVDDDKNPVLLAESLT